jgi:hypothetical protein
LHMLWKSWKPWARISLTPTKAPYGAVRGGVRELRPRGGRSPWRPLYRRIGDVFVVLAVGPEAQNDRRGFDRAVSAAEERLGELLREEGME